MVRIFVLVLVMKIALMKDAVVDDIEGPLFQLLQTYQSPVSQKIGSYEL